MCVLFLCMNVNLLQRACDRGLVHGEDKCLCSCTDSISIGDRPGTVRARGVWNVTSPCAQEAVLLPPSPTSWTGGTYSKRPWKPRLTLHEFFPKVNHLGFFLGLVILNF